MGNFLKIEGNLRQGRLYWAPCGEDSPSFLFARSRKPSELPSVTRIASASSTFGCAQQWRADWMTVEAAVPPA